MLWSARDWDILAQDRCETASKQLNTVSGMIHLHSLILVNFPNWFAFSVVVITFIWFGLGFNGTLVLKDKTLSTWENGSLSPQSQTFKPF